MIRSLLNGGLTKYRTIDICDIFGDGSGKALYRLDGNANDESGNYHGTETGITYGGGAYERGAVLDGSTSFILTGYTLPAISTYSLSAWIKTTDTTSNMEILADTDSAGTNNGSRALLGFYGSKFVFSMGNGSTSNYDTTTYSSLSARDGNWHHLCLTVSGTTQKMYIDGVLFATITLTVSAGTAGTQPYTIGRLGNYAGQYFKGSIDQVRIFSKTLSLAEVSTLYIEVAPASIFSNTNPFGDGNLKALYQFEGNANDETGVYNGTPTNITYTSGKFGQCAVFNGITSYIAMPSSLSAILTTSFSLSFYLNPSSFSTVGGVIETRVAGSWNTGIYLRIETNGTLRFSVNNAVLGSTIAIQLNKLSHICAIYNGSFLCLYINGILAGTTAYVGNATTNGALIIGKEADNTQYFNGLIDQVRIFNKALTPMEVACLYNETTPLEEPMHALLDPFKDGSGIALYRLDGNSLDESGNYNGTNTAITYGAGKLTRSAIFNGSSSYIAGAGIGVVSKSSNASVSVWFKTSLSSANQAIYSEGGDSSYPGFSIVQYGTNITVWWTSATGMNFSSWNNVAIVIPDTWNHLVITKQSKTFNMYLNGIYKGSFTIANTSDTLVGYQMTIGHLYGYSYYWNGSIDQLRIFNKALTQAEVAALYTEI